MLQVGYFIFIACNRKHAAYLFQIKNKYGFYVMSLPESTEIFDFPFLIFIP